MKTPIIEVRDISKKYLISHRSSKGYATLVETLTNKAKSFFSFKRKSKGVNKSSGNNVEEFLALQGVSFDVQQGDRVGIIGRNGAGKSTLLKILSRITNPSTGYIKVRGRISSLLEVGTGFHPELTGRENIYLNGAILGMAKQEIKQKFDEIVSFAEVEKFLDTPVKRYSSGMHMRLGFGIAAHLDPDVLIVDEVLAVGDARFQEKCLKKLGTLSQHGRTVLFVSHDMGSVARLCNKGLFLEDGQIKKFGTIEDCVNAYIQANSQQNFSWEGDFGDEHIRFRKIGLIPAEQNRDFFYQDEPIKICLEYEVQQAAEDALVIGIGVWNQRGQYIAKAFTSDNKEMVNQLNAPGKYKVSFTIPARLLYEGDYLIKPECYIHNKKAVMQDQVIIKLPIYPPRDCVRFFNTSSTTGVHLGNQWVRHL